jgi:hypothetical protein
MSSANLRISSCLYLKRVKESMPIKGNFAPDAVLLKKGFDR